MARQQSTGDHVVVPMATDPLVQQATFVQVHVSGKAINGLVRLGSRDDLGDTPACGHRASYVSRSRRRDQSSRHDLVPVRYRKTCKMWKTFYCSKPNKHALLVWKKEVARNAGSKNDTFKIQYIQHKLQEKHQMIVHH